MSKKVKFLSDCIEQYQILAIRENFLCCPDVFMDSKEILSCNKCKLYKTCNKNFGDFLPDMTGEVTQEEIEEVQELHPEYFI